MMDEQAFRLLVWILGAGVTIALTVVGAIVKWQNDDHKNTKKKLDDLRQDHSDFRVEVANKYVSHDQIQRLEERIEKRFDELKELLTAAFSHAKE